LGVEFFKEIEEAIAQAAETPFRYAQIHSNIRWVKARRFPYSVFYRVRDNRLVVVAIFHARRDPSIWRRRA
jgi:toxin ParE1/3/4